MTPSLDEFVKTTTVGDLRRLAEEEGRKGFVAQANEDGTAGQVRWEQASDKKGYWNQDVAGETRTVEQRMVASLHEGLPEVKRRTAQERFTVLFERLVAEGMVSYRRLGYPVWPKSIQRKLTELGWKEKDSDVYGQCRALAKQLFVEAGQKQKSKDQKRTSVGWHGHYNHELVTPSLSKVGPAGLAATRIVAAG